METGAATASSQFDQEPTAPPKSSTCSTAAWTSTSLRTEASTPPKQPEPKNDKSGAMEGALSEAGYDESDESDSDDEERARRLMLARKDARAILETADQISARIAASQDKTRVPQLPDDFGGEERLKLRDHQKDGLRWLFQGRILHINGILADEQGLGKTCQSIALLASVKQASLLIQQSKSAQGMIPAQSMTADSRPCDPASGGEHSQAHPYFIQPLGNGKSQPFWCPADLEAKTALAREADALCVAPPKGREAEHEAVTRQVLGTLTNAAGAIHIEHAVDESMSLGSCHLVIVPTSTLGNWQKEFDRWAPSLSVQVYRGSRVTKSRFVSALKRDSLPDVVLTTYSQLEDDITFKALQAKVGEFDYMVLDEAHGLKNAATRRYRRIAGVRSRQRLLLTGTPIQNNLVEVLTLLQFTLADLVRLSSGAAFQSQRGDDDDDDGGVAGQAKQAANEWALLNEAFILELAARKKQETGGTSRSTSSLARPDDVSVVESIRKTLSPFILRRTKRMVLSTLPPKVVRSFVLDGTPAQQRIYAITRALAARSRMLTENNIDPFAGATQSDKYAERDLLRDPIFIAGVTSPSPGLVERDDFPLGYSGGVALRDFRTVCGMGQDRGGAGFGPAGMSVVMNLRKIANHPMMCRGLYSDWMCLTLARVIRAQEIAANAKTTAGKETIAARNPFDVARALSSWPAIQRAMHAEALIHQGGGQEQLGSRQVGTGPGELTAPDAVSAPAARSRRAAASGVSLNEDEMFRRQEEVAAVVESETSSQASERSAKRSRLQEVETSSEPALTVTIGKHQAYPGLPSGQDLGVPTDMIPHLVPRYKRVSESIPAPTTAKELLVWARGDKRLANIAEEVLCYCDYEVHQICESEPLLKGFAAMSAPYVLLSGKAGFMRRTVKTLIKRGEKLLVFSQFTSVLSIYEDILSSMRVKHLRLDGSTNGADRQVLIDRFTVDDTVKVFLLSTKAGGVGLNLTAASCLIINDLDWNPHNDAQAEDRCHRIGQTKQVHVFRLSMASTIEQRMDEVAQDKQRLKRALLSDGPHPDSGKAAGGGQNASSEEQGLDKDSLLMAELQE